MSNDHDQQGTDDSPVEGQVSELTDMSGEPDAIDPSDATAGAPDGESGRPDEGEAGPDAIPADNLRSAQD